MEALLTSVGPSTVTDILSISTGMRASSNRLNRLQCAIFRKGNRETIAQRQAKNMVTMMVAVRGSHRSLEAMQRNYPKSCRGLNDRGLACALLTLLGHFG